MPAGSAISRRQFLAASVEVSFAIATRSRVSGLAASQQVLVPCATERVRLAVGGVRKRGFDHVRLFCPIPNVQVVAPCDVDESVLRPRLADMDKLGLPNTRAAPGTSGWAKGKFLSVYPRKQGRISKRGRCRKAGACVHDILLLTSCSKITILSMAQPQQWMKPY
jgi:hypothetical protein